MFTLSGVLLLLCWTIAVPSGLADGAGQAVDLHSAVQNPDAQIRLEAIMAVMQNPPRPPNVEGPLADLIKLLADPVVTVRARAAKALAIVGASVRPADAALLKSAEPKLLGMLNTTNKEEILAAIEAIQSIPQPSRETALTAEKLMEHPDFQIRAAAFRAVGLAAAGQPDIVARLVERSLRGDDRTRILALRALGLIKERSDTVLAALIQGVNNSKKDIRLTALDSLDLHLGFHGYDSMNAAQELMKLAVNTKEDEALRKAALSPLAKMINNHPLIEEALLETLGQNPEPVLRRGIVQALGYATNPSPRVTARLRAALADDDEGTRIQAALALRRHDNK